MEGDLDAPGRLRCARLVFGLGVDGRGRGRAGCGCGFGTYDFLQVGR